MEEAIISFAVETLGNLLIQKAVFLKGVKRDVNWLKDELKRMQCFLKDAAEKQANDERIRNWVSEIREVAQDAQDAIEIFILKVESARRSGGLLGKCASFPNHLYHLNKVGEEIERIRKKLQDIERSRVTYGIENFGGEGTSVLSRRSEEVESRRRLAHWQKDKQVVGLEKDVELLLENAILDEREFLSMATIVGMGGIGKSTLARMVYNHAAVGGRFDSRAWVVVSSEFRPREIIKELMLQLLKPSEDKLKVLQTMEKLELPNLQQLLHERLQGTRYLIILDDVWEDTHWEALASSFPDEDNGSTLLLTSRNRVITKYTRYVHEMKLLDPNQSWELFLKKAFINNTDGKCPEELENVGRQILNKCNGLPLAISVIGGLLVKQRQSKSGWEKVLKEMQSHLDRSESNIILAILELSYHNLPPGLKACFLSLAFFKEDAIIRAKRLVYIWIAQGFDPQEGEETMEEIARSYLDELINRNLVQVKDMSMDDQIKNCQIHDLIRELSITKAKEELSFEILREEGNSQSSHKPRHRAIYCSGGRFINSTNQNKHLRSLFVHGDVGGGPSSSSSYWKSFELLRILDFEGCKLKKLPNAIGSLIGLRYLGLRNTGIEKLPRSMSKLKNLQVLDLWQWDFNWKLMSNVIWKMDSLRHLYAFVSWSTLKISTLKNLQTLSYVSLRDQNLEQVTQMTSLCKLGIDLDEITHVSKLFTSLAMLENLVCLNIRESGSLNMDGLGTLNRITQLKLEGKMPRLPSACNCPPNLSYLTLCITFLEEDPMPILEKLPKLLYLKLLGACDYQVKEMVISHDGFPRLKVLRLYWLSFLKYIQIRKGAMSELKRLEIDSCPLLENLPEEVRFMSNLEELKMVTTTEMASKLHGVDSHIISNIPSPHLIGDPRVDEWKKDLQG